MQDQLTGKDLIAVGVQPGPHMKAAIQAANEANSRGEDWASVAVSFNPPPTLKLRDEPLPFYMNIVAENAAEYDNVRQVTDVMEQIMRVPGVVKGAVMPDAHPSGRDIQIPVGTVVASENIHPGMHSADVCCSVMVTVLGHDHPGIVLNTAMAMTHFGPGGRPQGRRHTVSLDLLDRFRTNPFLNDPKTIQMAQEHMGTQGDGNHFLYVGRLASTGETAIVTHHGSRGPGAALYKAGLAVAQKYRAKISPDTPKNLAWIPADTKDGDDYWQALQIIRKWTKANHNGLHESICANLGVYPKKRFWNEHNFVFMRDGLYYHAKGATPAFADWADDATDLQIIPLNMAEPILIVKGSDSANGIGFSPHGAGRNYSRSHHRRLLGEHSVQEVVARETEGLDVRFYCGNPDASELPSAYKRADAVTAQIDKFGLATVVDRIEPYGCIMAGDIEKDAPWRKKGSRRR